MERMIEVVFNGSIEDVRKQYDSINQYEKERMYNISVRTSFECFTDSHYYCYIILEENSKEIYENVLETNNILYICNDITEDVLSNLKMDILHFINQTVGIEQHLDYYEFKEEYHQWIYENLTVDGILDRINLYGMDNLRDIDYEFLDNNQ